MEFVKKHYEKVVLGLVILGLAVIAALLPFIISDKKKKLVAYSEGIINKPIKALPPLEMAVQDAAWQRAQGIYILDLTSKQHNTFNPVQWIKDNYAHPVKVTADTGGATAMEVTDVRELFLVISYDQPTANGYFISVERQNAPEPYKRSKTGATVVKDGSKSDAYTLVDVKGPPTAPTEIIVQAKDLSEPFSVGPGNPFKRPDGFAADLKYKPDNRTFLDQRVGNIVAFGPNNQYRYKIVAITQTSVVLSAESNKKNTTITFNPSH